MPNGSLRTIYTPWTPGLQSSWTVASVRAALTAHEAGDFSTSAQLIDAFGRDPRLPMVTGTRLGALFGCDFSLQPEGGDDADDLAVQIAEELEADWWDMFPESELRAIWRWRLFAGFAIAEKRWEGFRDKWRLTIKSWHPQHVCADEDNGVYLLQTREGQVEVPFEGDDKWLVFGRGDRPWMNGYVRGLAVPFLVAFWGQRDWARYSERHGMPIVKATVPAFADDVDKETFFQDVRALSTETTVQLPAFMDDKGARFDLDLCEATANTWEGFRGMLEHVHDHYAIALTGNNLTTLIQGGSFAASKEASDRLRSYATDDAQELTTGLRAGAVAQLAHYNYAGGDERVPWPHYDTTPPEDHKQNADVLQTVATAVGSLLNNRVPVDLAQLAERYGIPIDTDAETKAGEAVFKYHLDYGILTVNEVRERLGLEPIPGGDERPTAAQGQPADGADFEANATARTVRRSMTTQPQ